MNWLKNINFKVKFFILLSFIFFALSLISNTDSEFGRIFLSLFFITIPLVIFSFIILFLKKEDVFIYWFRFTKYIYFVILPFTLIHSGNSQNSFFSFPVIFDYIFDFIFIILYSLISLGIIIYHSFKKK